MAVTVEIKANFSHTGRLEELKQFITVAEEAGLRGFTWSADMGNQRESSQLTLNARHV